MLMRNHVDSNIPLSRTNNTVSSV